MTAHIVSDAHSPILSSLQVPSIWCAADEAGVAVREVSTERLFEIVLNRTQHTSGVVLAGEALETFREEWQRDFQYRYDYL